jgi:hypothetical protein
VDETGHSGDTGAAESGSGANSHDRTLLNGWATPDSPWSNAGSALDPEEDVPAWRRPPTEKRPFAQRQFPSGRPDLPPGHPSGEIRPPDDPPFGADRARKDGPLPSWSDGRARYADLLAHLSPNGDHPAQDAYGPGRLRRPDTLQSDDEQRAVEPPPAPASAPPYPYEGDLDDQRRNGRDPIAQQRAPVPLERPRPSFPAVRPATPGGRRADWSTSESARHALEPTPVEGLPRVEEKLPTNDLGEPRGSYDPNSFPRRLPYESVPPVVPPAEGSTGYADSAAFSGFSGRSAGNPGAGPAERTSMGLPQRVPAEPDVPTVPEPPSVEPTAETPALARIATHLRRGDLLPAQDRQEGFDVKAILAAVREVAGVRDASLRTTPAGAHSLRLDLADGADPAEVSRQVARLLQDRMGLDAAMQGGGLPPGAPLPAQTAPSMPPQPPGFVQSPTTFQPGPAPPAPQARPNVAPASVSPAPVRSRLPAPVSAAPAVATPPPLARPSLPPAAPIRTVQPEPTGIDSAPPRPLEIGDRPGPRVLIESVQVNTFGTEATVEVRLAVGGQTAAGVATGPAVDGYLLRLCATATAQAVDELLSASDHADGPAKCFVEHAASVPFGPMQVAVVVLLLSCGGWVEQLAGSAVVTGDDRHAMVRATLAAVNRRLEALLS